MDGRDGMAVERSVDYPGQTPPELSANGRHRGKGLFSKFNLKSLRSCTFYWNSLESVCTSEALRIIIDHVGFWHF